MNDFVLRGFCQCGHIVEACQINKEGSVWTWDHLDSDNETCSEACFQCECGEPKNCNGFLSPKQITLLCYSKEYKEFCKIMHGDWSLVINFENWVNLKLRSDPFFVAKILSDAGKDS